MGLSSHDYVAIVIAIFSAILVPVVGTYFRREVEHAVNEMEDRVEKFIRAHEKDPYAHPNMEIMHRLEHKIDQVNKNIMDIKLNCVKHNGLLVQNDARGD